jgi:hypothetical protein
MDGRPSGLGCSNGRLRGDIAVSDEPRRCDASGAEMPRREGALGAILRWIGRVGNTRVSARSAMR